MDGRALLVVQRGSNSTLLHCGSIPDTFLCLFCLQRGSNSTLLHCGNGNDYSFDHTSLTTRVEFDPPSLRLPIRQQTSRPRPPTRVEFDPPSLRPTPTATRLGLGLGATRVEFDPPSLRQFSYRGLKLGIGTTRVEFDPPSLRLIAQPVAPIHNPQRGSNSTLLHCGLRVGRVLRVGGWQRGSNSTLLHCGLTGRDRAAGRTAGNEGRIRPSFIAAAQPPQNAPTTRPTRVEFDPPSLRREARTLSSIGASPTRVEFDPPSLRHGGGRIVSAGETATRVEFDPPSLRRHL